MKEIYITINKIKCYLNVAFYYKKVLKHKTGFDLRNHRQVQKAH